MCRPSERACGPGRTWAVRQKAAARRLDAQRGDVVAEIAMATRGQCDRRRRLARAARADEQQSGAADAQRGRVREQQAALRGEHRIDEQLDDERSRASMRTSTSKLVAARRGHRRRRSPHA